MKTFVVVLLALVSIAAAQGVLPVLTWKTYSNAMDAKAISLSIAKFSAKFCNELDKTKSVISSPLSVELILGLLTLDTKGPEHSTLSDTILSIFSLVFPKLRTTRGVTLHDVWKVYANIGDSTQFKKDAPKLLSAEVENIDFGDIYKAANIVNNWVESKTNEKIKNFVPGGVLSTDTNLALVEALYFKGTWDKQFDPRHTVFQLFKVNNKDNIGVSLMHREDTFLYTESEALGAQLLQLYYRGKEASMLIILPRETGLDAVMQTLADGYNLLGELDNMYNTKVQVILPRFKMESEIDLKEILKFGFQDHVRDRNAMVANIFMNNGPLVFSRAAQKAVIEVNEEGAEAAAATAAATGTATDMAINFSSAFIEEPSVPSFVADRPFLAAILIGDTMTFVATYRGPQ